MQTSRDYFHFYHRAVFNKCCKPKTNIIALANHKGYRYSSAQSKLKVIIYAPINVKPEGGGGGQKRSKTYF